MRIPKPRESIILGAILLIANVGNCLYAAFGLTPSPAFLLLYYLGIFWAIAAWTIADARRLSVSLPFDMGWFLLLAWPVALPYHAFKTRGARGLVTLAGFLAMFVATYVLGVLVFYVVVAVRRGSAA